MLSNKVIKLTSLPVTSFVYAKKSPVMVEAGGGNGKEWLQLGFETGPSIRPKYTGMRRQESVAKNSRSNTS